MSEDQLRRVFAEGKRDWLNEHSKTGLDGQQVVEALDTQTFFELLTLPYPTTREGVLERLEELRLIERLEGGYGIRRIGALLLAKRLESFPELERKAPRVVVYSGTNKLQTRLDQTVTKGYAAGFQGLVKFVMEQLPRNEVIRDALRVEVELIPMEVVRELLANALIHQDFGVSGAQVMVEIYTNRLEISNPGLPIVEVNRFIDGAQSRNERLAYLMRRMRICEEKGSGIDRVIDRVELYQLPPPVFRTDPIRTVVVVYGPKKYEEMDGEERIRACYQHCVLKYVLSEAMTNQTLRQRFGLAAGKSQSVSQVIKTAMEAGLIKADERAGGSRKYAKYLPAWA